MNKNIPSEYKNLKEFLYVNFLQYYPSILEEYNGSDYFFGYKGNGLGFKLTEHKKIKSIGYYNESKVLMGVGKKNIIGEDKTFIEEGVFLNLK